MKIYLHIKNTNVYVIYINISKKYLKNIFKNIYINLFFSKDPFLKQINEF